MLECVTCTDRLFRLVHGHGIPFTDGVSGQLIIEVSALAAMFRWVWHGLDVISWLLFNNLIFINYLGVVEIVNLLLELFRFLLNAELLNVCCHGLRLRPILRIFLWRRHGHLTYACRQSDERVLNHLPLELARPHHFSVLLVEHLTEVALTGSSVGTVGRGWWLLGVCSLVQILST